MSQSSSDRKEEASSSTAASSGYQIDRKNSYSSGIVNRFLSSDSSSSSSIMKSSSTTRFRDSSVSEEKTRKTTRFADTSSEEKETYESSSRFRKNSVSVAESTSAYRNGRDVSLSRFHSVEEKSSTRQDSSYTATAPKKSSTMAEVPGLYDNDRDRENLRLGKMFTFKTRIF